MSFQSFVWGGFECCFAKFKNEQGDELRMDLLKETKHDIFIKRDYQLLKELGIKTVREGLSWSQIDVPNTSYNFSRFETMMQAASEEGIQQIWSLNHFDIPDDLDPFSEEFSIRFAKYARAAIKIIRKYQPQGTIYICPINEISFFSFMGGHNGGWHPFIQFEGDDFKEALVKAAIAAMDAIWEEDKEVTFIHVDPFVRQILKEPINLTKEFIHYHHLKSRFAMWDMISGKKKPELGGDPKYLQMIGINYYLDNQSWIEGTDLFDKETMQTIPLDDPDRIHLREMIKEVYSRYNVPIIISETGGYGDLRQQFWTRMLKEVDDCLKERLPLEGLCVYPIIDRPDWDDPYLRKLTNSGLWDFVDGDPFKEREPHQDSIEQIKQFIQEHS